MTTPNDETLAVMYSAVSREQLVSRLTMLDGLGHPHHDRECTLLGMEIGRRDEVENRTLPALLRAAGETRHEMVGWAPDGECTSPLDSRQALEAQREGYRLFSRTVTTTDWFEVRHVDIAGAAPLGDCECGSYGAQEQCEG